MPNSSSSSAGPGFLTLLAILFIGLKLTDTIAWSWWWVFSPLWIPIAFAALTLFPYLGYHVYKDLQKTKEFRNDR